MYYVKRFGLVMIVSLLLIVLFVSAYLGQIGFSLFFIIFYKIIEVCTILIAGLFLLGLVIVQVYDIIVYVIKRTRR